MSQPEVVAGCFLIVLGAVAVIISLVLLQAAIS